MSHSLKKAFALIFFVAPLLSGRVANAAQPILPDTITARDMASISSTINLDGGVHYLNPPSVHIDMLQVHDGQFLSRVRRLCAMGVMPQIAENVVETDRRYRTRDHRTDTVVTHLPAVADYCTAALAEARRRNIPSGLYLDLAVQEQGVWWYTDDHATLVANGEPWRITSAVLKAANAGQSAYTTISGATRPLTCPLALDAGYTWASSNANAKAPLDLTTVEAQQIAADCYAGAETIIVRGTKMPAVKAGLVVGASLAKSGL